MNDTVTPVDTITVTASGTGSDVTYRGDLELHGAAQAGGTGARLEFEKLDNDTEKQLTEVLNDLAV